MEGFELTYGMCVNFHKSNIGGVGIRRDELRIFSTILNCNKMTIPFMYLGILVGVNLIKSQFWEHVITGIRKKLTKWKDKLLSFVGRVGLINLVLSVLPLFNPSNTNYKGNNLQERRRGLIGLERGEQGERKVSI